MQFSNRKQQILNAIVEEYVATAEPVGSQTLVARHALPLSAATVRNVMAELEEAGYLSQAHTSAGRTPTDRGYRFYVNGLLDFPLQNSEWRDRVQTDFDQTAPACVSLLHTASSLLTEGTGYTAFAVGPQIGQSELLQIKLLMIEPGRVLVVLVLKPGVVKDRVIRVPEVLYPEALEQLSRLIESQLSGKRVEDITWVAVETAAQGAPIPPNLLNQVLLEAYLAIKQAESLDTCLEGMTNLLNHPEFRDARKAKTLLDLLMREGLLAGYLNEHETLEPLYEPGDLEAAEASFPTTLVREGSERRNVPRDAFCVRIGQEITLPGFEDCSFITTTYRIGGCLHGKIGVVGPKRMPYQDVIAQIAYVKQELQNRLQYEENPKHD